jgi:hypothetical protein
MLSVPLHLHSPVVHFNWFAFSFGFPNLERFRAEVPCFAISWQSQSETPCYAFILVAVRGGHFARNQLSGCRRYCWLRGGLADFLRISQMPEGCSIFGHDVWQFVRMDSLIAQDLNESA